MDCWPKRRKDAQNTGRISVLIDRAFAEPPPIPEWARPAETVPGEEEPSEGDPDGEQPSEEDPEEEQPAEVEATPGGALFIEAESAEGSTPGPLMLGQNFPNPFNPSTTIRYQLPRDQEVRLSVYGLTGQLVRELVHARRTAGYHSATWDGRNGAASTASQKFSAWFWQFEISE